MRLNRAYHGVDALHHGFEAEIWFYVTQPIRCTMAHLVRQRSTANQRLAGHTAVVQAVAAHFVGFNQRDFGLDNSCNVRSDQTARPRTNDHQIAVKFCGLNGFPARINLAAFKKIQHPFYDQRQKPEQYERANQAG